MSVIEKLRSDMRANPRAVEFADLRRVLEHYGVRIREGKGSHCVVREGGDERERSF